MDISEQTILKEDVKVKKPKMYKILLHNDDYTSMEFVVQVLVGIFNKRTDDAVRIMLDVHKKGIGIAGIYSYDIAITKISQAENMAKEYSYPLKLSLKEV
jgi:ATP-dependent Clp protease adaptor protein ClpS